MSDVISKMFDTNRCGYDNTLHLIFKLLKVNRLKQGKTRKKIKRFEDSFLNIDVY